MLEQFGTVFKLVQKWVKGNIMPLGTEKTALLGAAAGAFEWDLIDSGCSSTSDGGTWF